MFIKFQKLVFDVLVWFDSLEVNLFRRYFKLNKYWRMVVLLPLGIWTFVSKILMLVIGLTYKVIEFVMLAINDINGHIVYAKELNEEETNNSQDVEDSESE